MFLDNLTVIVMLVDNARWIGNAKSSTKLFTSWSRVCSLTNPVPSERVPER